MEKEQETLSAEYTDDEDFEDESITLNQFKPLKREDPRDQGEESDD